MAKSPSFASSARKTLHQSLRKLFAFMPRSARFALYRSFVDCDPSPDERLVLKIADTREELEACFTLLHDAYVGSGFMKPDPSGMRVTMYHALPTTTTLCAKFDGRVVGTMSLIRQSPFGFPLQTVFDLTSVEEEKGKIAEVSALAVHPEFRKTGGMILFPLMKFMYQYCTTFFDTKHLVIAVNPYHIELYESLLSFQRLPQKTVANYDFANGAPAVGASLNLHTAPAVLKQTYGGKDIRKNLYQYFLKLKMRNIVLPNRRYFTTNDPVMTPALLDHFFNQRTQVFAQLDERKKAMLHAIYNLPDYQAILPKLDKPPEAMKTLRQSARYSLKCPGTFDIDISGETETVALQVVEISGDGFQAHAKSALPSKIWGKVTVQLGSEEKSSVRAMVMRGKRYGDFGFYGFRLAEPDLAWRKFVGALQAGKTHEDLQNATLFMHQAEVAAP